MRPSPARLPFRALLVLVSAACAVVPAQADASTSSAAVAALNQLRAKVGVPSIVDDPVLAAGCDVHATYMQGTGVVGHFEDPANPFFSYRGDDAAKTSVLAFGTGVSPYISLPTNPWYPGAPLHLYQMLHPGLVRSGYALVGNYSCMSTLTATDTDRGKNTVYTFPEAGARSVPPQENTSKESPSPNQLVGLPKTKITGPYILVYATGFSSGLPCTGTTITAYSLKDAAGRSIPVRKWDEGDARHKDGTPPGVCHTTPGGGYIVPVSPLRQKTTYTASVTVRGNGIVPRVATKTWTFTTSSDSTPPKVKVLALTWGKTPAGKVTVSAKFGVTDGSKGTIKCSWRIDFGSKAGASKSCKVVARRVSITGSATGTGKASIVLSVRDALGNARDFKVPLG